MWCIDQVRIGKNICLPSHLFSILSFSHIYTHEQTKMLINLMLQEMIDGHLYPLPLLLSLSHHMKDRHENTHQWSFSHPAQSLSLNNWIFVHQSCICHSWYVLSGFLPGMLCSIHFDSPRSVQVWRDQAARMMVFHSAWKCNVTLLWLVNTEHIIWIQYAVADINNDSF